MNTEEQQREQSSMPICPLLTITAEMDCQCIGAACAWWVYADRCCAITMLARVAVTAAARAER